MGVTVCVGHQEGRLNLIVRGLSRGQQTGDERLVSTPSYYMTLQSLNGKRFFTSLDLACGYWQIPLTYKAKEISAFTTAAGLYRLRVLPLGPTTASSIFEADGKGVRRTARGGSLRVY